MKLWDAFLEDYGNITFKYPLKDILELFWYYCQDGTRAVEAELIKTKWIGKATATEIRKSLGITKEMQKEVRKFLKKNGG